MAKKTSTKISMNWSHVSIISVIAFLLGWLVFGLFGAVLLAIIALLVTGILKVKT